MNVLKTYTVETRATVFSELINAADSFDSSIYKEEVLSKLASQEQRILEEAARSGDTGVLANYTSSAGVVNLSHKMLIMLSPQVYQLIAQLTNLQALDLSGNGLTSLPPEIGQLTNLQRLDLSGNGLTSLPPEISQLTNLVFISRDLSP